MLDTVDMIIAFLAEKDTTLDAKIDALIDLGRVRKSKKKAILFLRKQFPPLLVFAPTTIRTYSF